MTNNNKSNDNKHVGLAGTGKCPFVFRGTGKHVLSVQQSGQTN